MDEDKRQAVLTASQLRLVGPIDENMYAEFRNQLSAAPSEGPLVVALTTLGGDPEIARTMADDVRLLRDTGRTIYFLGKAAVYSAGATFMAGFPVANRLLTRNTTLMVHERQLTKTIALSGPLRTCTAQLKAVLNEIEQSIAIEEQGFREFVRDSRVEFEELRRNAPDNWYIPADQAKELELIAEVI